jgi:Holliday junction DNA helicase RuvA
MLTRMTGTLTRVLDDEVRLAIDPYEYQVLIPESVRRQVQMHVGRELTFHVTEYLEGTPSGNRFIPRKIGFLAEAELEFFELLCTVEKIGVKKALKAMARPVRDIADAISRQDTRWLSTLPGIGTATAEQIVTTLKRKVTPFLNAPSPPEAAVEPAAEEPRANGKRKASPEPLPPTGPDGRLVDEVYQALMSVGHTPLEARTKLDALLTGGRTFATVEEALLMVYSRG